MIDYSRFKAHPTMYANRQYRSRLEARWAAFFTLCGWRFEYEPFDLNGWVPDFLVVGSPGLLIEVKPIDRFDSDTAAKMQSAAGRDARSLVLVGSTLLEGDMGVSFGWMLEDASGWDCGWDHAIISGIQPQWRERPHDDAGAVIGAYHNTGSYHDRITGAHGGDHHIAHGFEDRIRAMWALAANAVQWKAPR